MASAKIPARISATRDSHALGGVWSSAGRAQGQAIANARPQIARLAIP